MLIKTDNLTHAARGANRIPVVINLVELDEEISREERFPTFEFASVVELLDAQFGQIAGESLSLKMFKCAIFLAGLTLDDVPARAICGHGWASCSLANVRNSRRKSATHS